MIRLKTSQPKKKFGEKNQNIKKRFKKAFFTQVERENLQVCQQEAEQVSRRGDLI